MNNAIAFFAYNRVDYISDIFRTINDQKLFSIVYCFIDYDLNNPEVQKKIEFEIVQACNKEIDLKVILRSKNLGSGGNVNEGLDEVFLKHSSCVILEDDCIPSPAFYPYMHAMLAKYEADERVGVVTGSNYASEFINSYEYDIGFSKTYTLWGWGIWRSRWLSYRQYDRNRYLTHLQDGSIWITLPIISRHYWMASFYKYYNSNFAWDLPLVMYCLLTNRLCLFPNQNLVKNAGISDGKGVHVSVPYKKIEANLNFVVNTIPQDIFVNSLYEDLLSLFAAKSLGGAVPIGIPVVYLGVWDSM